LPGSYPQASSSRQKAALGQVVHSALIKSSISKFLDTPVAFPGTGD